MGSAIGDHVGILGIRHLDRYLHNHTYTDDLTIANRIWHKYILGWSVRLDDGTVARKRGSCGASMPTWPPADHAKYLWGDDLFMGLTLATRMAAFTRQPKALSWIEQQHQSFSQYLQDTADGLFYHGYNHDLGETNCCKWGRVNGWAMMAQAELLLAMHELRMDAVSSPFLPLFTAATKRLTTHAQGMVAAQSEDGRWRQLVNESSTFLETSGSAMTVYALSVGLAHGWLDSKSFLEPVNKAWAALANETVTATGNITGVCTGTCIAATKSYYENRTTGYWQSSNGGVGSLLRAAAAVQRLRSSFK